MLASHALALVGVPIRRVIRIVQDQRDARYKLLRGFFRGADDDSVDELHYDRLATLTIPQDCKAIGRTVDSYTLSTLGVRVVSMRHSDGKARVALGDAVLQAGDTLVLAGKAEALALAEQKILKV
jgi:CPA2 family monovalent cation:H+ antiporter-2